jgi:hypothetical protein
MSAASIHPIRFLQSPPAAFLGPATVVEARPGLVLAARADGVYVEAQLALQLPYEAAAGDVVLVIAQEQESYVIGVLSGRGKTSLALPGDVALRAVDGALELSGDLGVTLRGPEVNVHADTLRRFARSAIDTVETLIQRIAGLVTLHAGQQHTVVEDGAYTQAKTAAIQTEGAVTINGKEILLG